jgi:trimethylamine--corrinoid protein Co-methyltransferase
MKDTAGSDTIIKPVVVKPEMKIQTLTRQDLDQLHQATLTVLAETGVRFPSRRALDIFATAGAIVDFKSEIVKIPSELLLASLGKVPRNITMGSRGPTDLDAVLDGTKTYCGTAGTGITTVDYKTGMQRPSTKEDAAMMARVADYLTSIGFYWPMVAPLDKPREVQALHELEAAFSNTEKHVISASCVDTKTARSAIRIAEVVAGSSENLKTRSPLSLIVSPISPLNNDKGALDAALVFAEAGLPVGFATMPVMGSTGPASIAGTIVLGNAEILSAICLLQLSFPGTPVTYPFFSGVMNPHTGVCVVTTKNQFLFYAATIQMGHYYNLPVMSTFGGTDLCEPDSWQVGKDEAVDAFYICAAGADMAPCLGMMETYTRLHPEKLILDHDIIQSIHCMTEGFQVDAHTLAIDEIAKVGPCGHFLSTDYTIEKMRGLWNPGISHQWDPRHDCFLDSIEAARNELDRILTHHQPHPLAEAQEKEIKNIIESAEKEL